MPRTSRDSSIAKPETSSIHVISDRDSAPKLTSVPRSIRVAAIGFLRRVVQLAEAGVTSARVVPGVGALGRGVIEPLVRDHPQRWIDFAEQRRERSAHDAAADESDVDVSFGGWHPSSL